MRPIAPFRSGVGQRITQANDMLCELIYISIARNPMTEEDMDGLLSQARDRNGELDVTGVLFFNGREFMQLLEGAQADVDQVYSSIEKDRRHREITVLHRGRISRRAFAGWTMAFEPVAPETSLEKWRPELMVPDDDCLSQSANLGFRLLRLMRDNPFDRAAG